MFSEKMRRVLAYKNIPWRAVEQPAIAPKPDLTPLTGGYRRIPVMQIGADIYCDTTLMIRVLEKLYSEPTCLPADQVGAAALIEDWADHRLFLQVVPPVVVELQPAFPQGFFADRSAMSSGFTAEAFTVAAPYALAQTKHSLTHLNAQLAQHPFLLGDRFTVADAACFHCVWLLKNSPSIWSEVSGRPALAAWFARIEGFGPGIVQTLSNAEALRIARASRPRDIGGDSIHDPEFAIGTSVTIVADDYGKECTTGRVARLTANEITVLRDDPALGELAVHYPRAGYKIEKT